MSEFDEDELPKAVSDSEDEEQEREDVQEKEMMPEHEDQMKSCPLDQDTVAKSLSLLCRTGNGLSHAYVRLDLHNKGLTDLVLLNSFVHLRYLDISSNHLSDLSPLAGLVHLLWVKGDSNLIQSCEGHWFDQLSFLQWLSLASNRLCDAKGLKATGLETLNLIGNGIQTMQGLEHQKLTNLVTLELRGNSLETTDGIYLPNLRHLYLAKNKIKRLDGLEKLGQLNALHLRDNQLESLDGINASMKCLQYLNIRGNLISSQRALQALVNVEKSLKVLVLMDNPLSTTDDYRLYVISHLSKLERLDKDPITADEKFEANEKLKESEDNSVLDQEEN